MELFLTLLVGAVVGVVMGLLGAGGSLLTVPALILVIGMPAQEADEFETTRVYQS